MNRCLDPEGHRASKSSAMGWGVHPRRISDRGRRLRYFLIVRLQIPRSALSLSDPRFPMAFAIDLARWVLAFGCVVSVAMGILVLFLPRVLDSLETHVNRWVSTRNALPPGGDDMRTPLDLLVAAYPRAAGIAITVSSLVVAVAIACCPPRAGSARPATASAARIAGRTAAAPRQRDWRPHLNSL